MDDRCDRALILLKCVLVHSDHPPIIGQREQLNQRATKEPEAVHRRATDAVSSLGFRFFVVRFERRDDRGKTGAVFFLDVHFF